RVGEAAVRGAPHRVRQPRGEEGDRLGAVSATAAGARVTALAFRVYGVAQGMGSKRAFVPKGWTRPIVTDTNRNLKSWQSLVAEAAGRAISERVDAWRLLEGPIRLSVAFYLPRPASLPKKSRAMTKAPDTSKLTRPTEDAHPG